MAATRSAIKPLAGGLGKPKNLPPNTLPTNGDVLKAYFYLKHVLSDEDIDKSPSFATLSNLLIPEIKTLWDSPNGCLPFITTQRVEVMLKNLLAGYRKITTYPKNRVSSEAYIKLLGNFADECEKLFDICTCKCPIDLENLSDRHNKVLCKCPDIQRRVPVKEAEFLVDQRTVRKMHISAAKDKKAEQSNLRKMKKDAKVNEGASTSTAAMEEIDISSNPSSSEDEQSTENSSTCVETDDSSESDVPLSRKRHVSSVVSPDVAVISAKKHTSVRAVSALLNVAAKNLGEPEAKRHYSNVYRNQIKSRFKFLEEDRTKLRNAVFHQLCFDGKKLFDRERLAIISNFIDGTIFTALKTFRKTERVTGENCFNSIKQLVEEEIYQNIICLMSDTTALNTGSKQGICTRLSNDINKNFGHDVMVLECLYHTNELYLKEVIKAFDGDTASPETLEEGAVFNLIHKIEKFDLKEANLKNCSIKPSEKSSQILSNFLEYAASQKSSKKSIRDDQAVLLVLSCRTFCQIPMKLKKYLYYQQESIHHARWMTVANGYLRILNFNLFNLDEDQTESLLNICQFVLDVYVPLFCSIYLNPSVVEGPHLTLLTRDLMKASNPEIVAYAKPTFIRHGSLWVSPKNVGLSCFSKSPPVNVADIKKITTTNVQTKSLLWSNKPLRSFFENITQCSPCFSIAQPEVWKSFKNNQMANERCIGYVKQCVLNKKVVDSVDDDTDEAIAHVDKMIRGYVAGMMREIDL